MNLDSPGGELEEALKIGRIIRGMNLHTFVADKSGKARCDSACFFLWAGGIYRVGYPSIHRPYLPDSGFSNLNMKQTEKIYEVYAEEIDQFLEELSLKKHLPPEFISVMMSTRPDEVFSMRKFKNETPSLFSKYEPHIEQYFLDKCGSLSNTDCMLNESIYEIISGRQDDPGSMPGNAVLW